MDMDCDDGYKPRKGYGKDLKTLKPMEDYFDDVMAEKSVGHGEHYEGLSFTSATEMEGARREISCLDNQLVAVREAWRSEKKGLEARWKIATDRHNNIYDSIPALCAHHKETIARRVKSHRILLQAEANTHDQERDIRRMEKEIAFLIEIRDSQKKRLQQFEMFKDYLNKVKELSLGEYGEIPEIIQRYNTLVESRRVITERNQEVVDYMGIKQKTMEDDLLIKSNEIMIYRNYLSELLEYKDAIQEEAQRLDDSLYRIKLTAASRTKIIGQIKMSIDNLYKQVCKYMHRPPRITANDTLGQLSDIGISVGEMNKLSKDIKHMVKSAFETAQSERELREKIASREEARKKRADKLAGRDGGGKDLRELLHLPRISGVSRVSKVDDLLLHHTSLDEAKEKEEDL